MVGLEKNMASSAEDKKRLKIMEDELCYARKVNFFVGLTRTIKAPSRTPPDARSLDPGASIHTQPNHRFAILSSGRAAFKSSH